MLTQTELMSVIHYNPNTGEFFRLVSSKGSQPGLIIIPAYDGYVRISIENKRYYAHRLAWLYMTGEWPTHHIDHEDTNKTNNKWNNIRNASRSQNLGNRFKQKNNKSGFKGVFWNTRNQKWCAVIKVDGTVFRLGHFTDVNKAAEAYEKAANEKFKEFART